MDTLEVVALDDGSASIHAHGTSPDLFLNSAWVRDESGRWMIDTCGEPSN